jgi:uncharacterized protein (TIGR00369 family)
MARKPVEPSIEALVRNVLIGSPVASSLGIELAEIACDRVVLRLPFSPGNITVGTIVHGGVIATLIDTAAAAASASGLVATPKGAATSSLTISYLAPADRTDLTVEAVVIRRGKRQTVEEVTVHDAAGTLVAKALVTSQIF